MALLSREVRLVDAPMMDCNFNPVSPDAGNSMYLLLSPNANLNPTELGEYGFLRFKSISIPKNTALVNV